MRCPRLIMLLVICLLLGVGSSWAGVSRLETVEASSSSLPSTKSLCETISEPKTLPTESRKTGTRDTMSESDSKTSTNTSTAKSASSKSTSSNTDSVEIIIPPSLTRVSKSTGRSTRTVFVTQTTIYSNGKSDSTSVASTLRSDGNVTTSSLNITISSSARSTSQISLSTTLSTTATTLLFNWTFPGNTSSQSNITSATGTHHQSGSCPVGSGCAWKLGVGLSFSGTFAVGVLFLISRKYRKYLNASHQEYHENWDNRRKISNGCESPQDQMAMKMLDTPETRTAATSLHSRTTDELYLPQDVDRLVDRAPEMQQEYTRLPVEAYGTIKRKSLPSHINAC